MEQVKKILVIGIRGMAGHLIYSYLKESTPYRVVGIARGLQHPVPEYNLDVSDFLKLAKILDEEKPDVVINCVGVLNEDAEHNPDKAILLNSYLPHFLARAGSDAGFKVIHISTDCVFSGKSGGYREDSIKDGLGIYAQSKALGELGKGNTLTIRTSIIGPELNHNGIGLFNWFMLQKGTIKGYSEAYWTGVTTVELAKAIVSAIKQDLRGLFHLVNGTKINKFDLLRLLKEVFVRNEVFIEKYDKYKVDKSLVATQQNFDHDVPTYEVMVREMKRWMDSHPSLYHYNSGI